MIRDVLTWWSRQMLDLVPARFARPDPSATGALLLEPFGGAGPGGSGQPVGVRLLRRRAGLETLLATVALPGAPGAIPTDGNGSGDAPPTDAAAAATHDQSAENPLHAALTEAGNDGPTGIVLLRLPPGTALQRDVMLPLAAEAGLERVLTYEMDRLTPFTADDVFFAWDILRRDREGGRLSLRLSLVPRGPLLGLLAALREAGADAQAIEIPVPPGQTGVGRLRIPLAHVRPASARRQRRLLLGAAIGCAMLALLAILLPFILQAVASSRLDREIAALQQPVQSAQAMRRRIAGSSAGADLVAAERRRLGDALQVLASLTQVLPDDSYLSDMTLRQGQLNISGQSPGAAKLISIISASPEFSAPAFSAPVTRIDGQNTDLFSIRAGVAR